MLIDGFMFFNELDLLEIRLHELNDLVSLFIQQSDHQDLNRSCLERESD